MMSFFERYQKSQDKSSQAKEWFEKGEKYFEGQEYDQAIEAYTSAIFINQNYEQAYFKRGRAYGMKGQYDKVIDDFNMAIAINPNGSSNYYLLRGLTHAKKGHAEMAIEDYSRAIEIDSSLYSAYLERGRAYDNLGQYDKAIEDYNKAISISPGDAAAYQMRGWAHISAGKINNAIEDLTKALTIDPDNIKALTGRGFAYADLGNKEKAIINLKKACDMGEETACKMLKQIDDIKIEKKPLIKLKEIEPFNIPPVDDSEAAMFTKRLTGNETFEFDGDQRPMSILFYDLKYNYPEHSYAHGWLISKDVDSFLNMCNSGRYDSMEPILKSTVIGSISFEYGGNLTGTQIQARKLTY